MSKEINVADAGDWSKEEADFNLHYLEDRGRTEEAAQVREALGLGEGEFPASGGPAPASAEDPSAGAPADDFDLTSASVDQVKEWVGDDPDRAQKAYDYENSKAEPRKSLIEWLESIYDFE